MTHKLAVGEDFELRRGGVSVRIPLGRSGDVVMPFALAAAPSTVEGGVQTVSLSDRTSNLVVQGEGVSEVRLVFPAAAAPDVERRFTLVLECGAVPPAVSLGSYLTVCGTDSLSPGEGVNIYSFSEFAHNKFTMSRTPASVVAENVPDSGEVLSGLAGAVDAQDFGDIQEALGLPDTATLEDAVEAVMQRI